MRFHRDKAKAWEQYNQCEATMLPLNNDLKYAKVEPPARINELLGANVHIDIKHIRMPPRSAPDMSQISVQLYKPLTGSLQTLEYNSRQDTPLQHRRRST
eukprot:1140567_1